MDATLIWK